MDYHAIFLEAIEAFIRDYEAGHLRLLTKQDLQAYLFHYCLEAFSKHYSSPPYKVHCGVVIFPPRERVDIALGDREAVARLRLEPDYPGLPPSEKPFVFSDDIEHDFKQLRALCERGVPHAYAVILDEDGRHLQAFPMVPWRKLKNGEREAYLLVRHFRKAEDSSP